MWFKICDSYVFMELSFGLRDLKSRWDFIETT
jgi:hypothetical protein